MRLHVNVQVQLVSDATKREPRGREQREAAELQGVGGGGCVRRGTRDGRVLQLGGFALSMGIVSTLTYRPGVGNAALS